MTHDDTNTDSRPKLIDLYYAQADLLTAVRRLIAADNCNYQRDTIRYEGLFDDLRSAYQKLTGDGMPHPNGAQKGVSCLAVKEETDATT